MRSVHDFCDGSVNMKTALVVEDHPDLLKILVLEMEMMGFSVITASNGRDGVKRALEETPHMILMDIMMPFMDGIDATRVIRSNSKTRNVPILAATAMTNKISLRRCIDAGCNDYLTKPFTYKALQKKIQDLVPSVCDTSRTTARNKHLSLFSNQADFFPLGILKPFTGMHTWRRMLAALQVAVDRFRDYISRQSRREEGLLHEPEEILGPGTQNLIENDVPKLATEVKTLKAEREQLRGIIQSLKQECSTLSRESNEHLKEMQAFQAIMQETLDDFRKISGTFNESESLGQVDQTFFDSTSRYSSDRRTSYSGSTGINGLHSRKGTPIRIG
jgi:CheY-like chemotaxis protein/FtsZ-binding cell division protein ZapB